jgi:hypothetical protein
MSDPTMAQGNNTGASLIVNFIGRRGKGGNPAGWLRELPRAEGTAVAHRAVAHIEAGWDGMLTK